MNVKIMMEKTGCSRATAYRLLKSGKKFNPDYHIKKINIDKNFNIENIIGLAKTTINKNIFLTSIDPAIDYDDLLQECLMEAFINSGKLLSKNFLITIFKRKLNDFYKIHSSRRKKWKTKVQ